MDSVLAQTYPNLEYIVIDGGSADNSRELIQSHADRIAYWVSEPDRGVYHAMNKGIKQATGDYLLFLNSGDSFVHEQVLAQLIEGEEAGVDLIYGDLKRSFPDGHEDVVPMPEFITVDTMMTWTLCHPVTLIHRRLFQDYGLYDERLKIVADWAFFFKVIVLGNATQKHKPVVVANFVMDGMSSLPQNQKKIDAERDWVKKNYPSPAFLKLYQDYFLYKDMYHNKWVQRLRKIHKIIKSIKG